MFILPARARLQLEAEEDDTIHRNKQRMLNVYATRYIGKFAVISKSLHVLESSERGDSIEPIDLHGSPITVTHLKNKCSRPLD